MSREPFWRPVWSDYGSAELFWRCCQDKMKLNGFKSFDEGMEFYQLVGENMSLLHQLRTFSQ